MQVNVSDPTSVEDLTAWLERVGCRVDLVDRTTLDVSLLKPIPPVNAAEIQLDLFLRVWEVMHGDRIQARRVV